MQKATGTIYGATGAPVGATTPKGVAAAANQAASSLGGKTERPRVSFGQVEEVEIAPPQNIMVQGAGRAARHQVPMPRETERYDNLGRETHRMEENMGLGSCLGFMFGFLGASVAHMSGARASTSVFSGFGITLPMIGVSTICVSKCRDHCEGRQG